MPRSPSFAVLLSTALALAGTACPGGGAHTGTVTHVDHAGPGLSVVEAGRDLDGATVGPPAAGQTATVAMVFASWCSHCRHEIEVLAELRDRHPEVRFLGINYKAHEEYDGRGDAAAVRAFVAERAPWLRVVPADDAMWTSLGRPPKVPTVFVFDRAGALVRMFDRRREAIPTVDDLEAVLAGLAPRAALP